MFYVAPANAQATRTWVSGVGDDANPCSRTAPCKTFAGAISKTATNGEINCLDPGGFGGVTIVKAISIICDDVEGGVLVSGTNAIIVNAPTTAVVILSGLDIEGLGTGLNGVSILAAQAVHVLHSTIADFKGANGSGISFRPGNAAQLYVDDCIISENGQGTGAGILVNPTGAGGSGRVSLNNVRVENSGGAGGFRMTSAGNTSATPTFAVIENSRFSGNTTGVSAFTTLGNSAMEAMLSRSTVFNNTFGIDVNGSAAVIRVSDTVITGNNNGVSTSNSGQAKSYGNNRFDGNTAPGAFTPPNLPPG